MVPSATFNTHKSSQFRWAWCGQLEYEPAAEWQQLLVEQRKRQEIMDTLLFLEHPHVYTLGRSATQDDILLSPEQCQQQQVSIHHADRGGKVTYHGPGQLVGYFIFNLRERKLPVPEFVWRVEEGLRDYLASLEIIADRLKGRPGLWCAEKKIASVGFHIHRGISYHGFALNLQPELAYFSGIIPCGFQAPATSVLTEQSQEQLLPEAAQRLADNFAQLFSISGSTGGKKSSPVKLKSKSVANSSISSS